MFYQKTLCQIVSQKSFCQKNRWISMFLKVCVISRKTTTTVDSNQNPFFWTYRNFLIKKCFSLFWLFRKNNWYVTFQHVKLWTKLTTARQTNSYVLMFFSIKSYFYFLLYKIVQVTRRTLYHLFKTYCDLILWIPMNKLSGY